MIRVSVAGLALVAALASGLARAQSDETVRLTVRSAEVPMPALKYHFLPELREQTAGNAAQHYYRAILMKGKDLPREQAQQFEHWLNMPLKELPRQEVRQILEQNRNALRELRYAAMSTYCDWQEIGVMRREGVETRLPALQHLRELANWLRLQSRLQLAEGHFQAAIETLQTGFALARHASQTPTLINALVGIAIGQVMAAGVEEAIQAPQAPNLYWALTDLPVPFIDVRRGLQGEILWLEGLVPGMGEWVRDLRSGPLSVQQVQEIEDKLARLFELGADEWQTKLYFAAAVAKIYPHAQKHLIDQGRPRSTVEAMPMGQVALLYALDEYVRLFDEMRKWQNLPYWQANAGLERAEQMVLELKSQQGLNGIPLATMLLPATWRVSVAAARIDRRIAALRCIEALRLYAASHDGKLPAELGEITEVPIPVDPFTGKPFAYLVRDNTVELSGPPPTRFPHAALRYEVVFTR